MSFISYYAKFSVVVEISVLIEFYFGIMKVTKKNNVTN